MKVTIIITAWKEHKSIGHNLETLIRPEFNNIPEIDYEIMLICPDELTRETAERKLVELNFDFNKYVHIEDPAEGKPTALNLGFRKATGDILILTDGDTYLGHNSINPLIRKLLSDPNIGAVTGRPISSDRSSSLLGYWGHLLSDAAHHKRTITLTTNKSGTSSKIITNKDFFTLSGYLTAMYKPKFKLPKDVLADDAYMSYMIIKSKKRIAYEPEATVYIKYPTSIKDWYNQKARSLGGYIQLWKYGFVTEKNKTRSFWHELEYFWFPIKYAKSLRELFFSLLLYPTRLILWVRIAYERKIKKKSFEKTWVRIESTK